MKFRGIVFGSVRRAAGEAAGIAARLAAEARRVTLSCDCLPQTGEIFRLSQIINKKNRVGPQFLQAEQKKHG